MTAIGTAVVGFLAAIIGGFLQAWVARRYEIQKFERQNRHDAYIEYVSGISRLSFANDDESIGSALAQLAEARSE